ncbi:unnamed protein product [Phyllotreta striolata]|uniref:Uncharacterized protein n=1 Tax=Phyllotreta striolata TaxID=444603 RepID=A0A9N9TJH4_PHYSR|nr:unnamed protein product [Phyllotreta striolata]
MLPLSFIFFTCWLLIVAKGFIIGIDQEACNLDESAVEFYGRTVKMAQFQMNQTCEFHQNDLINYFGKLIDKPRAVMKVNYLENTMKLFDHKQGIFSRHSYSYLVVFVADGRELGEFVEKLEWTKRITYLIIFTTADKINCDLLIEGIKSSLRTLSKEHHIFRLLAHAPCLCHPHLLYRYQPFAITSPNNFGSIEELPFNDTFHLIGQAPGQLLGPVKTFNRWPLKTSVFQRHIDKIDLNKVFRDVPSTWRHGCLNQCDVNAHIWINLARYLNFTIATDDDPEAYYGTFNDNGQVTGVLGKLVRQEIDFAGNSRFVDTRKGIEYTVAIYTEEMCIVVPKSPMKPSWLEIFGCFDTKVWLLILVIEIISLGFWYKFQECGYSWMVAFAISITVAAPLPKTWRFKYLLVVFMLYSVIISTIFEGNLVKSFGTVQYYPDMTLDDFINSDMKIHTSYIHIFDDSGMEKYEKLKAKIVDSTGSKVSSVHMIEKDNRRAALIRKSDAKFPKILFADDPKLHVIPECPRMYLLAFAVQKNSPYLWEINRSMVKLSEGGFVDKWKRDMWYRALLNHSNESREDFEGAKALPLHDIAYAFYIPLGGSLVAFVVFVLEYIIAIYG